MHTLLIQSIYAAKDDIVPTSCVNGAHYFLSCPCKSNHGLAACTAVVTEIGYKKSPGIEAEVHFMPRETWRTNWDNS